MTTSADYTTDPTYLCGLAAVCAEPADDTERLKLADWLEENGQGSRLIGWQIRTGAKFEYTGGPCQWIVRDYSQYVPTDCWAAAEKILSQVTAGKPIITRGFVSHITISPADWFKHHGAMYWQPDQMMECLECEGTGLEKVGHISRQEGLVSDWDVERYKESWKRAYGYDHPMCICCSGTGRVPRPVPPTAQPLTHVNLTSVPLVVMLPFNGSGPLASIPGLSYKYQPSSAESRKDMALQILAKEWPKLIFDIPSVPLPNE